MGGILQFKRLRQEVGQEGEMCAPHGPRISMCSFGVRSMQQRRALHLSLHYTCNAMQTEGGAQHSAGVMPCCQALWSVKTTRQLPSPTSHPWPCRICDLFCKMECPPPPSVLQWALRGLIAMGLSPTLP